MENGDIFTVGWKKSFRFFGESRSLGIWVNNRMKKTNSVFGCDLFRPDWITVDHRDHRWFVVLFVGVLVRGEGEAGGGGGPEEKMLCW